MRTICKPSHNFGAHTPQYNGLPLNWGHAVCLDTNAHDGGWLTCLDVCNGRYWLLNEAGETRTAFLP